MFLEEFAKLGDPNGTVAQAASKEIFVHVSQNAGELEYAVTRLIRGLESHKISTRTGSYGALATLLGMEKLKPEQLREFVQSVLVTDQQSSKKERRLVYIARILAFGALIRNVPLATLLKEDQALLKDVLSDLVELGKRRSTLMQLATPFFCHVINDPALTQDGFDSFVWPAIVPLFTATAVVKEEEEVKIEEDEAEGEEKKDEEEDAAVGKQQAVATVSTLHIALLCAIKGFKTDFEFLDDMSCVVGVVLGDRIPGMENAVEALMQYVKNSDIALELWDELAPRIRSPHFETICLCVEKAAKVGISQNIFVRDETVAPFLSVLKDKEASDQHTKALATLDHALKWELPEETGMKKKQRKAVLKVLFGGVPNILHEYQIVLRVLNPFLTKVATGKDLKEIAEMVEKHLEGDGGLTVRMGVVYIQFLSRLARAPHAETEMKTRIALKLIKLGLGVEKLTLGKDRKEETPKDEIAEKEMDIMVKKVCLESLQSVLSSTYDIKFMEDIFQFLVDEQELVTKSDEIKKTLKKVVKLSKKIQDGHFRYVLQSYAVRLIVEQNKVLGEAKIALEELLEISKTVSTEGSSTSVELIKFMLSTTSKEAQPPFNHEAMFARLTIEDKITDDCVQVFAESIDVHLDDVADAEDEDSSDDSEDGEVEMKEGEADSGLDESGDEEDIQNKTPAKGIKLGSKKPAKESDEEESDSESSVDMDEATEDDLKNMDEALSRVFATKKKVKEEESSENRSLMRTFRLLDSFLGRKAKGCHVSIPLMLLMPIIHSLQSSIRVIKKGKVLSTRIVSVLNKLNAIKKFEEVDSVESGSLFSMARDVSGLMKDGKNKMISDLLGDSLIMITKCFLLKSKKTKGEMEGFLTLYTSLMDLNSDTRTTRMGFVSSVMSSALTSLPSWDKGKQTIVRKMTDIIFSNEARAFRRHQFLTVLRACLSEKSNSPEDISNLQWKKEALGILTPKAIEYLESCNETMPSFTREIVSTFTDCVKDDTLRSSAVSFFSVLTENQRLFQKLNENKKLAKLLVFGTQEFINDSSTEQVKKVSKVVTDDVSNKKPRKDKKDQTPQKRKTAEKVDQSPKEFRRVTRSKKAKLNQDP